MSDVDALRAAVVAAPDDDLPRLVLADFLEEGGDPDRAAFIRAQCRMAAEPAWEPFPTFCRTRKPEWTTGRPWMHQLPPLRDGGPVTWAEEPFRRGCGWAAYVSFLPVAPVLLDDVMRAEPVGALALPTATLDQWQAFAGWNGLARIRHISFRGFSTPIEPLRVLRDHPNAVGVRSISLTAAGRPSVPVVVGELFASPLGRRLESLTLPYGREPADELIDAMAEQGAPALRELTLPHMNVTRSAASRLASSGLLPRLRTLDLSHNRMWVTEMATLVAGVSDALATLALVNIEMDGEGITALARAPQLTGLRRLLIGDNRIGPHAVHALARSPHLAGLRSLRMPSTQTDDRAVRFITRGTFWPNLVELDLSNNPISDAGARHLLTARPAPDLTWLVLPAANLSDGMKGELRTQFGEAVHFDAG